MNFDNILETDEMREIFNDFLTEADEITSSLDQNLINLESHPDDTELLNEIFRAVHTIKGAAGFLSLDEVTRLSHRMEDILNKLRKTEISISNDIIDMLLKSLDILKQLIEHVRNNKYPKPDIKEILQQLESLANEEEKEAVDTSYKSVSKEHEKRSITKSNNTIRINVDRLDELLNMMGELVLSRNSIIQTVNDLMVENEGDPKFDQLSEVTNSINFITSELQMTVMKMRMQPVSKVFNKIPRYVRDIAREEKKKINIQITGEDTEVDKAIIENIADPLIHILRNACSHGIELPNERKKNNKLEEGMISLSASQEGSNILIRIKDDGRGLDIESIKKKAIELKMISESEINNISDKQVFDFIFRPGFSTAKNVSGISGRGVGMDVVNTNIEKLNGTVEVNSARGKGTTITIKLPLTLAIVQGLLVESDNETYVLPMSTVVETVQMTNDDIYYLNKRPVFRLRDEVIPVVNINHVLNGNNNGLVAEKKPYIVVISLGNKKLGVMIDKFLGQEEVVVKPLGQYMSKNEGIAGATILGTGHVRLIVDVIGLFNLTRKSVIEL